MDSLIQKAIDLSIVGDADISVVIDVVSDVAVLVVALRFLS